MTNNHINFIKVAISHIWKEENITPNLGEKFKENETEKPNHRIIFKKNSTKLVKISRNNIKK